MKFKSFLGMELSGLVSFNFYFETSIYTKHRISGFAADFGLKPLAPD